MPRILPFAALAFAALSAGCGSPSPTAPSASPGVYRQGTLKIPQTYIADFDKGILVDNPYGASDVWFEAQTERALFLSPTGGQLVLYGAATPGFDGCKRAAFSKEPIPFSALAAGVYVCGKTDELRIVEIRVLNVPAAPYVLGGPVPELTLEFTTYNK